MRNGLRRWPLRLGRKLLANFSILQRLGHKNLIVNQRALRVRLYCHTKIWLENFWLKQKIKKVRSKILSLPLLSGDCLLGNEHTWSVREKFSLDKWRQPL